MNKNQEYQKLVQQAIINNNETTLPIKGMSMYPTIKHGDKITLKRADISQLSIGDVIAVREGQKLQVHRIVWKKRSLFVTKGDHNFHFDSKVKKNQIIGLVTQINRRDNRRFKYRTKAQIIAIISLCFGLIHRLYYSIRKFISKA